MIPNPFNVVLKQLGKTYKVERNNQLLFECRGVDNKYDGKKSVDFAIGTDINEGDYLINSVGERFYVDEITTEYLRENATHIVAFYKTKKQLEQTQSNQSSTFNIQNAYNSVIGNQHDFTFESSSSIGELRSNIENSDSQDKEQLDKIADLLEMLVNNQIPPSKGLFSKFSAVIQKNSWISSHIGSIIVSWLTARL